MSLPNCNTLQPTSVSRSASWRFAWTIAQPGVAIVGAQHVTYLQHSAGAADVTLSQGDLSAISDIAKSATPVGGPYPETHAEAG